MTALLATPDGGLLVGTGIGLMRYESGRINWLARAPELALPDVRTMIEAPDGTVWFGMSGGGLGRPRRPKIDVGIARGSCGNFGAATVCRVISCNAFTSKVTGRFGLARSMD